ncbi:MAG TPA: TIGR03435 family protein [Bryobacteraceae bacterium]|jgi:uncharacterized protein (TIGR03435 family)|nr:TIGR03435 family protein [Bryobacteraceae bacterium]
MRLAILCLTVWAAQASAQQFEVASIKTVNTDSSSSGIRTGHGRLDASNVTLQRCIIGAWGVGPSQVVGGPAWLTTDRFDISAKAAEPTNDDAVLNLMLRRLLADRFQLALHTETRTMQAYILEVAKGGPNPVNLKKTAAPTPVGASTTTNGTNTQTSIEARQTSMDLFAKVLARELRLPVVDRTGLAGDFDFTLSWTPDRIRATAPADSDLPTIFTAVQDQLGLHLRAEKTPIEVLVIDRAEKPSGN